LDYKKVPGGHDHNATKWVKVKQVTITRDNRCRLPTHGNLEKFVVILIAAIGNGFRHRDECCIPDEGREKEKARIP
jgi:hypothetical protein